MLDFIIASLPSTIWSNTEKDTSKTDINRKTAKTLVQIIISALYDAMKLTATGDNNIINFDQTKQVEKIARRFSPEKAAEKIADMHMSLRWIDSAVNEKLIFEQLLLNLAASDTIGVS